MLEFLGDHWQIILALGLVYYGASLLVLWTVLWLFKWGKVQLWQFLLLGLVGLPLVLGGGLVALLVFLAHLVWEARKVLAVNVGRE